jgi:hypothetical protein
MFLDVQTTTDDRLVPRAGKSGTAVAWKIGWTGTGLEARTSVVGRKLRPAGRSADILRLR